MDSMNEWFNSIIDEINEGKKINKKVLKEFFDKLTEVVIYLSNLTSL
jgi:hypothetical protein